MSHLYTAYPDLADALPNSALVSDIPQFPRAAYEVTVSWDYIEKQIEFFKEYGLDLNPDFQREHVWTRQQQTAYIEYMLMGGELSRVLIFAAENWHVGTTKNMVLVDGKQRLEAVRAFLRNEVPAFRRTFKEYGSLIRRMVHFFQWRVVEVATRVDLLKLYLSINAGGTPHDPKELQRVQALLAKEVVAGCVTK